MVLRREPTYLSTEVFRACLLLSKARGKRFDEQGLPTKCTADEVADGLLREIITSRHPSILEHQKVVAKLEENLITQLEGGSK